MILALALAVVVPASPKPPPAAPTLSKEEQAVAGELARALRLPPKDALLAVEAILTRLGRPTPLRHAAVCARAGLLGQLIRDEFKSAADECYRLAPTHPMALGMYASAHAHDMDPAPAVRAYLAMLREHPQYAQELEPQQAMGWLDRLNELRQDKLASELLTSLTRAGFATAHPIWASHAALGNIQAAVDAGRITEAKALLPNVISPADAKALLVDRSFAPIATDIRAWAADGLVSHRDALVSATQGAFHINPSLERRRDYAEALLQAGRRLDAINLLRAALVDKTSWDETRYEAVMTAIRLANILSVDGDHQGATTLLERMAVELSDPQYRYGAVSIAPNLARIYVRAGRHQDALALLDRSGLAKDDFGNEAHRGFLAALRGCALAGLGRRNEAERYRAELDGDTGSTPDARRMLVACLGDQKAVTDEILFALEHPQTRRSMLVQLRELEISPDRDETDFGAAAQKALQDPAVRKRLDELSWPVDPAHRDAFRSWTSDKLAANKR